MKDDILIFFLTLSGSQIGSYFNCAKHLYFAWLNKYAESGYLLYEVQFFYTAYSLYRAFKVI